MKIARIFLKPDGQQWRDILLADGQDARTVFAATRTEGAVVHPLCIIPESSIHNVVVMEVQQAPQMDPFEGPTSEGKPN